MDNFESDESLDCIIRKEKPDFYDECISSNLFPAEELYYKHRDPEALLGMKGCLPFPAHTYTNIAYLPDNSCLLETFKNRLEEYVERFKCMMVEAAQYYGFISEADEDEEREGMLLTYHRFCFSQQ